jgi:hypothetical protein
LKCPTNELTEGCMVLDDENPQHGRGRFAAHAAERKEEASNIDSVRRMRELIKFLVARIHEWDGTLV